MYATNVRNLKKNPSVALREAETSPVLILKGNQPNALLLHLSDSLVETEKSLLPALASSLYKDGTIADHISEDYLNKLQNICKKYNLSYDSYKNYKPWYRFQIPD